MEKCKYLHKHENILNRNIFTSDKNKDMENVEKHEKHHFLDPLNWKFFLFALIDFMCDFWNEQTYDLNYKYK